MDFSSGCDIRLVASFLKTLEVPEESSFSETECQADQASSIRDTEERSSSSHSADNDENKKNLKIRGNRETPSHEIIHRQFVNPEDIYLRTSDKDPGIHCSDETEVIISLPGTKLADISLDVTEDGVITCETEKYFLQLTVQNDPSNTSSSRAKWDPDCSKLTVTVPKRK